MKVTELTVEQLKILIEDAIDAKLEEYFGDPDEGLELRKEVIQKLNESKERLRRGEKGIPLDKVAKKLGIKLEE